MRPLLLSILQRGENYGYALVQEVKELSGRSAGFRLSSNAEET
jgi:hypothetical protein